MRVHVHSTPHQPGPAWPCRPCLATLFKKHTKVTHRGRGTGFSAAQRNLTQGQSVRRKAVPERQAERQAERPEASLKRSGFAVSIPFSGGPASSVCVELTSFDPGRREGHTVMKRGKTCHDDTPCLRGCLPQPVQHWTRSTTHASPARGFASAERPGLEPGRPESNARKENLGGLLNFERHSARANSQGDDGAIRAPKPQPRRAAQKRIAPASGLRIGII